MIVRIRLKAHPDKYCPKENVTYSLACDETRASRTDPTYYTKAHIDSWFVPEHQANSWTKVSVLKRTLSASTYHKWYGTTWTAYEVVHVDTGVVEPLDVFLLRHRDGKPDPTEGNVAAWNLLKKGWANKPEHPYSIKEAIRLIPKVQEQRQDSTTDQLETVLALARRAGCYDAEDLLRKRLKL